MTQTSQDSVTAAVWDQQSIWSQSADRLKASVGRARLWALALGTAAAALGAAASQAMGWNSLLGKALAFAAAAAAGTAPVVALRGGPNRLSDWTRLRAVSEALKTEVYTYLAGVGAYRDAASAPALLAERSRRYRSDAVNLVHYTAGVSARQRPVPAVVDADSYVEHRLRRQITSYYRPKAQAMHRKVRFVERTELALGCFGGVLAAASGAFSVDWVAAWVAVVASISIAVTAHAVAQRYAYQHLEFTRTAEELERLLERWTTATERSEDFTDAFVSECEGVISIQNEAWMIRWTVG
ncbi:DUF4231 domain-containing protein [Streptomyces curacoi]|uniref:SMODS and SLOG-associating 2TM effector domain-containing protein n=1 Tax=Streptomyces curacoi TaxID=146536 RepID=A0A124H4B2_9ACTN|nr:DUF4231 domain-containing protein [Streptomyces curacoi]KUM78123.1 hypothetical protein AQI70_11555 [Streptomyces curacoi]